MLIFLGYETPRQCSCGFKIMPKSHLLSGLEQICHFSSRITMQLGHLMNRRMEKILLWPEVWEGITI